ncbi:bifunctional protein-disulfide isomerase/oxidoreductase DsbC [Paraglaciecola aquimarina]|uniref:Thiol:disulfide interchange protein n=1 Tax=Paraglaciecola algarum TaxID=3050085 RepID=A0ABS9D672_9ALTE|nr:bifunctional protein-disulfide isomerase/oxidoreductase DsbC [Paraglaciecola sp. G1-23]MCF2948366.1 bifunctional protein-disulfide isomerase/oxidoreductase DsbC [Paraglaciecola sp. G1-23]
MNKVKILSISLIGMLVLTTFVLTLDRSISTAEAAESVVSQAPAKASLTLNDAQDFSQVRNKVSRTLQLEIMSIAESPVPGLLQVMTERGLFYVSQDGSYFVQGRIFNLDQGMRNETEVALTGARLAGLENFKDSVIEYKAEKEKYVVNVFTDITCGYCRKFHNEMQEYNDLGITVRYLAFPRAGLSGQSYHDMVSVWCADNPQKAMDEAKNGSQVAAKKCQSKIAEQFSFAQQMGVNSTPNIVLPDGSLILGYQPPAQLEQALKAIM